MSRSGVSWRAFSWQAWESFRDQGGLPDLVVTDVPAALPLRSRVEMPVLAVRPDAAPAENRDLLRQQLDAAKQQLEDEKSRYNGLVAMHNEQMEQLKALNARLRAIENNGALAGAGG